MIAMIIFGCLDKGVKETGWNTDQQDPYLCFSDT